MLAIDEWLRKYSLGLKQIDPPKRVGGIGGACRVVMAVKVPLSLGGMCGVAGTVIVPGDIPFLVPLPLLKALGAVMHLEKDQVCWKNGRCSPLVTLASGHTAVSLTDHLGEFMHAVPNASEFQRGRTHEEVRAVLLKDGEPVEL
eukprot:1895110-Amphidinium_carterae.1